MTQIPEARSAALAAVELQDISELLNKILAAYGKLQDDKRLIVGIAGAPASGKSTLAQDLVIKLNGALAASGEAAVVVPMDGYHLDNSVLDERGLRHVKGAPHTFDVSGFKHLLHRLSQPLSASDQKVFASTEASTDTDAVPNPESGADPGAENNVSRDIIYIPVFDRAMDLARCAATAVRSHHRIIVVEGNYLLLDRPIWSSLKNIMDLTVWLNVPLHMLEERLIKRWLDHGLDSGAAKTRALENDIPNACLVIEKSTPANFALNSVR